jgi:alcohol dehydrogenase (cytochrome c)
VDGDDLVIGAGKAGRVIAWDRDSRRRVWSREVGLHRNDAGPLPLHAVTVCPGLLGGVETPMAYAGGRVFVPVVDLCGREQGDATEPLADLDPARGRGRLVAIDAGSGAIAWQRRLPSPVFGCATVTNGVVFTATFDGTVYGLDAEDGRTLWRAQMRAGINACPAVVGGLVLFGAGVPRPGGTRELVAFGPG